ncbi:hypothetical protein [Providencia rettgeri]|uniref:hypothetical protein n=1 Tax=Providencia rettgeri TaxID=587 RepID=UPI00300FC2A0
MDTIYALLILFVLYCIISDWFMHEYGEKLNGNNFYKFKIGSFFFYQVKALKPLKKLVRLVNLNEDNLAKQPIFWIGIILPLVVAGWVEYNIILLNSNLLSFEEIRKFYEASTPALYITALTPTLGILISNIHRTIQSASQAERTEKQIKIAKDQFNIVRMKNNQDLFYSHHKYVTERIKNIKREEHVKIDRIIKFFQDFMGNRNYKPYINFDKTVTINIKNENILYNKLFYTGKHDDYFNVRLSHDFISDVEKRSDKLSKLLNRFHLESYLHEADTRDHMILLKINRRAFSPKTFFIRLTREIEKFEELLNIDVKYDRKSVENFLDNASLIEMYKENIPDDTDISFQINYTRELIEFIILYNIFLCIINALSDLIEDIYTLTETDSVYEINDDNELEIVYDSDVHNWFNTHFMNFHFEFYDLDDEDIVM